MKNLPNVLSLTRIPLAVIIAILAAKHSWTAAFLILLAAGITDVLDGWIAKQFSMETKSGELFDMIGDLAMTVGALVGLLVAQKVSWNIVIVMAIILVAVQFINSFLIKTVLFTHFGKWFMPCYFLLVLWMLIIRYAWLALGTMTFGFFAVSMLIVTIWLVRLKRHRFAEWFNGKPMPA